MRAAIIAGRLRDFATESRAAWQAPEDAA